MTRRRGDFSVSPCLPFSVSRFYERKINKASNFRKTKELEGYQYDL